MNADHDVAFGICQRLRRFRVENLPHLLDFQIMIAGTERAHLFALALLGAVGDFLR